MQKSFNALQGAGLCHQGLSLDTAIHTWKVACQSILQYGCESVYMSRKSKGEMDKLQAKLLKCIVGIGPNYRTTPLLEALYVQKVSRIVDFNTLMLFRHILHDTSAARVFNLTMLKAQSKCESLLVNRAKRICTENSVNLFRFVTCKAYVENVKKEFLKCVKPGENETVDSLRILLKSRS